MTRFKLYGKCQGCRRNRFFISVRRIKMPNGMGEATNRELICGGCFNKLKGKLGV